MKTSEALFQARQSLVLNGVSNSKLDSLILLTHAFFILGKTVSKEQIIFNPEVKLDDDQQEVFFKLVARRAKREPVSYIIGKREFFGSDFLVNSGVLDPRPDSETLVELVLKKFSDKKQQIKILEVGVGSGCLIISILKELKNSQAIGLDISQLALEVCKKNAELHQVEERLLVLKSNIFEALFLGNINFLPEIEPNQSLNSIKNQKSIANEEVHFSAQAIKNSPNYLDNLNSIEYIADALIHSPRSNSKLVKLDDKSNLISPDLQKFDLIISNPPYISSSEIETLQDEVKIYEPRTALDGGSDGLDFYRKIALDAKKFLKNSGKIILEIGVGQGTKITKIFSKNGFALESSKPDLSGVERVLCFANKN